MIVLQCIADAAHVTHGPVGCLGNSWESRGTVSDKGILHRRSYTTDLKEMDIVHGAEEKLYRAIRQVAGDSEPKAVFVYSTCVSGIIGEDISAVCRRAERRIGVPVIPVDAPGFVGPKNLGNRIAGEVLLDRVIGTSEPKYVTDTDINLIGEYNIAGDLELVEPVLKRAGFNVKARITGNSTYDEIASSHRSKLNVVVCGRALVNVAKEMETRYGIPYVEVSFFGRTEMSKALRNMADALKESTGKDLTERVQRVIADEEKKLSEKLLPYGGLAGRRAVLYTGGVKSWSFIGVLRDLGIEVCAVGTKKATKYDEERMRELLGDEARLFEDTSPGNILRLLQEHGADMLIAGGRNMYLGIKHGYPFVDVNQERNVPYAGYEGLVRFAKRLQLVSDFYDGRRPVVRRRMSKSGADATLSINPLKHSPSMGAAIAMQGVHNAAAVMHGAQGCNFLGKVLLTKHFRDPISMMSTKMFVEDVVMGGSDRIVNTVGGLVEKSGPEIVGVISATLSEVRGEDTAAELKRVETAGTETLYIPAPDYAGGLEEGYAAAVGALVELARGGDRNATIVNVLAGPSLTPGDIHGLRETITTYGLTPVILPDISALDGSREEFSGIAKGGTTLDEIKRIGTAGLTIAIGASMKRPAEILFERFGIRYELLNGIQGLAGADELHALLKRQSGFEMPAAYARQRRALVDGMRDAVNAFAGKRVALALEAETALGLSEMLAEMGAVVEYAAVPVLNTAAEGIIARHIESTDFGSILGDYDLFIASSHGEQTAERLKVKHFVHGFPVFERLGYNTGEYTGYRGTLAIINAIGNALREV